MMPTEQLRKCGRAFVADLGRNATNSIVAGFEQKRSLRHSARDQVSVHGLPDERREASRKRRAAKPHTAAKVAKGPGLVRLFVD